MEINKKNEKKLLKKYEHVSNGFYLSKSLKNKEYEFYSNTLNETKKNTLNNLAYLFSALVGIFVSKINKIKYFAIKNLKQMIRI